MSAVPEEFSKTLPLKKMYFSALWTILSQALKNLETVPSGGF